MDFEIFKETRSRMIGVLIEAGQKNSYSSLLPIEGKSSFYKSQWYIKIFNFNAYAGANNLCFFGGWPSYKRGGLCKEPWKYNTKDSFGISYDSDHYCGHDDMFRCNPLLFGPGDGEHKQDNNGAGKSSGKCINFKSGGATIKSVTKQCFEKTKGNLEGLYQNYVDDEDFRGNFEKLRKEILLFCEENSNYSACNFLLGRIEEISKGVICLNPNGSTLDIGNSAIDGLTGITGHLNEENSKRVKLNLVSEVLPPEVSLRPVPRAVSKNKDISKIDKRVSEGKAENSSERAPIISVIPKPRPKDLERSAASISGDSCRYFSKFKKAGINEKALKQALFFYEKNKGKLRKERYVSIADYGLRSNKKRFYILDMKDGTVRKEKVSHGSGTVKVKGVIKRSGDPNHDGMLDKCHHGNNTEYRKNMTRGGFFITSSMRNSPNHGPSSWPTLDANRNDSMFMDGMSPGINDEARRAHVVMHGATYNTGAYMGRSFGCPAFTPNRAASIINTIKEGSLYYSYIPQCRQLQRKVDEQVSGWSKMCE